MRNVGCGTRNDGHGKQKSKVENRSAPIPSIVQSEAHSAIRDPKSAFPSEAIIFWHNRLGLPLLDSSARPKFVSDSLWSLIEVVGG
jgi:hypothetical protein